MADDRLVLTGDERRTLENWVRRRRTAQGLAQRARIVLACAQGGSNAAIAARLGGSRTTVRKWRTRFLRDRLDGLPDEPRPGEPRTITDAQVEEARELLRTRPSPLTWDQTGKLRGGHPAWPPPRPSAEPVTVQRVAGNTGIIVVIGQKIALGRIRAGSSLSTSPPAPSPSIWAATTPAPSAGPTTQPVRSIKASTPQGCQCF
jgi:transposase-like protein